MSTEERIKVLNMIAEGQISAEEGANLLSAMGMGDKAPTPEAPPAPPAPPAPAAPPKPLAPVAANGSTATRLRVKVTSKEGGKGTKVNINLPISLIDIGLRLGGRFVPELEDITEERDMILQALSNDIHGKIVEVDDGEEHVEIYLE